MKRSEVTAVCILGALFEGWLVANGAAVWVLVGVALGIIGALGGVKLLNRR